ncbi:MAG: hypothetical protein ABSG31_04075 [Tepidisphaeraceae bacterium]|jgi:hypothetical protein
MFRGNGVRLLLTNGDRILVGSPSPEELIYAFYNAKQSRESASASQNPPAPSY